MKISNLLMESR